MKNDLFKWLDETFNDFYSYTDESGEVRIIEHLPTTKHSQMWKLLQHFQSAVFTDDANNEYIICENAFTIQWGIANKRHITIRPYDNQMYHTSEVKDNG